MNHSTVKADRGRERGDRHRQQPLRQQLLLHDRALGVDRRLVAGASRSGRNGSRLSWPRRNRSYGLAFSFRNADVPGCTISELWSSDSFSCSSGRR